MLPFFYRDDNIRCRTFSFRDKKVKMRLHLGIASYAVIFYVEILTGSKSDGFP